MIKIGSVCKCRHGKLGVITKIITSKKYDYPQIIRYRGINFNGNSWESVKPELIANNLDEYLATIKHQSLLTTSKTLKS